MRDNERNGLSAPKPILKRLLTLFVGGMGCLVVGLIAARVTGDMVLLGMSAVLCLAFIAKGFLLRRKILDGKIYSVSGVCVSIAPKFLGRYRRIELVNPDNGEDIFFILPKKIAFKIGHVYTCYFDNIIDKHRQNIRQDNRSSDRKSGEATDNQESAKSKKGGFFNVNMTDMDLPTNGFLGFEDFGVYQEKPKVIADAVDAAPETTVIETVVAPQ
jgi:hypothetical protein